MARVSVTYWGDIPVLVTAREGGEETTVPLSPRFQELVDAVAMQAGVAETEAYLARWRTGPEEERPGPARMVADEVAGRLEAAFGETRARYVRPGGPLDAHDSG